MTTIRILVIDDEPVICDGCRMVLSEKGYHVDTCPTGNAGLRSIETDAYDAVLLDMKLPDIDGMEILRRMRTDQPEVNVIVMTGYSTVTNAVEAMKLGAFDYLAKPFDDEQISLAVKRAVENKHLREENLLLRTQIFERYNFDNIIGENPRILKIFYKIRKVAPTDTTVLIEGESGTGKELFARAIHAHSQRAGRQFIAVDCSTFSTSLMESELFGHVKGAFTGAVADKAGIFEIASGGTLFLDEVANINQDVQGKLLRVMETREFKPVGANRYGRTDTRIIAASNQNLKKLVDNQRFREDFYYRLSVVPIFIPPLRQRRDDIPRLAYHFLRLFCRKTGKRLKGFSDEALEMLINYQWPGNVRQLKNVVERLVIMSEHDVLSFWDIFDQMQSRRQQRNGSVPESIQALKEAKQNILNDSFLPLEKAFLQKALKSAAGNISRAADQVGMQRSNFSNLMKKHGIAVNAFRNPSGPSKSS
jgi:two-component system NtrC family response regulator